MRWRTIGVGALAMGTWALYGQSTQNSDLQDQQARLYVQARQYPQAAEIYQQLLTQKDLEMQQRQRLLYNLGTVRLLQGRWQEGMDQYSQVLLSSDDSNELWRRYSYNLALGLRHKALRPQRADRPYSRPLTILRLAENWLEISRRVTCISQNIGQAGCFVPADIAAALAVVRADILAQELQVRTKHAQEQLAMHTAGQGVYLIRRLLTELNQLPLGEAPTAYFDLLAQQCDEMSQLLKTLTSAVESSWRFLGTEKQRKQSLQNVEDSKQKIIGVNDALKREDSSLAEQLLEALQAELYAFVLGQIRAQHGTTPLEYLLGEYQVLTASSYLTFVDVQSLIAKQQEVVEKLTAGELSTSDELLQLTSQALQQNLPSVAKALLSAAQSNVWTVAASHSIDESPVAVLRSAFLEQLRAQWTLATVIAMPEKERHLHAAFVQPLHTALRQAQARAVALAATFPATVFSEQTTQFKQQSTCVRHPWQVVMPLFFDGFSSAEAAQRELSEAVASLSFVDEEQKVAYRKWLKALEVLGKELTARPESQDTTLHPQTAVEELTSVEEVLRLLQQMGRKDRPFQPTQPKAPKGIRPW